MATKTQEICRNDQALKKKYDKCVNLDRVSYMTVSGPLDVYSTGRAQLGKLLLLLNNSRFLILEKQNQNFFGNQEFVNSINDNILKRKVELTLAFLV